MSGFDEIFKDFENDVRIASHIPAEHRGRAIEGAAGAAALRVGWRVISGVFFDDHSSTWRDGKGNIVPPPSERGDSNRVFSRGMMLETGASRPEYKRAERRWVDKHPTFPLDSSDPAVVEKHLQDVYESNNVSLSADDARAMREFYERTARGPKLPHYGGKEAAIARKALEKLRQPAALPLDAAAGSSSVSSSPPVLVDNKERDRPALDERPRRVHPYTGDAVAAPLGDHDEAAEAPVTRYGVTRRNGEFFMSYQGREFAIPDSDPQEYNPHWQKKLARFTGDDLVFRSAKLRGMSQLFYRHGSEFVRNHPALRGSSEDGVADVMREFTSVFGKPQEVEEAERRARFSGEPPVGSPGPKRPISEIVSAMWSSYRAKRPAPAAPSAPDAAARPSSPPSAPPAAEVDLREPVAREYPFEPIEIEVNDAPGAPYQPPSYFDVDAPRVFGASAPGMEYQPTQVLLHEDQVEVNRKRRYNSRVLVRRLPEVYEYVRGRLKHDDWSGDGDGKGTFGLTSGYFDPTTDVSNYWCTAARHTFVYASSSTDGLVLGNDSYYGPGVAVRTTGPYEVSTEYLSGTAPDVYMVSPYQQNFLTYVPQGVGVSQRIGCRVSGNYLQCRVGLSPVYYIPEAFRPSGGLANGVVPYSDTAVQYTGSLANPASTQALFTVHRVMLVLTTDPRLAFSDVVVDARDVYSPVSLHTRGALEVLKDVYVESDKETATAINLQLKGREFFYSRLSTSYGLRASVAEIEEIGFTRGYHIVCLHVASVLAYPYDVMPIVDPGGYRSRLALHSIPPRCHLSSTFSFSDA